VATTNALDERMAGDDHSGRGPARARASVAATSSTGVIAFDLVVGALLRAVPHGLKHLVQHDG
jgi:hypothetical protein